MKTKLQILKETFNYYNEDVSRRAINNTNGCDYLTEDGRMCAFGRCEIEHSLDFNGMGGVHSRFHNEDEMNDALKEEYRGHSMEFWADVQSFHDDFNVLYWDGEGITPKGLEFYENLCAKHAS